MDRRRFIQGTTGFIAAASLERVGAQTTTAPAVKTVRTNILEIGYHESGDASGFPVILLHGFPDDAHAYDGVAPLLARRPDIAPSRSTCAGTDRRGFSIRLLRVPAEQAAIGQDVIDLADALKLPRFAVAGFDWGGRAACVAAALHPDRVRAAVLIGGYSIQNTVKPPTRAARPRPRGSGISGNSTRTRAGSGLERTATISASCSGTNGRRPGGSPTRCTTSPPHRSTIPTSWTA